MAGLLGGVAAPATDLRMTPSRPDRNQAPDRARSFGPDVYWIFSTSALVTRRVAGVSSMIP